MATVLFLTTYPIRKSVHGGQRRSSALLGAYKRAGFETIQVAVFNPPSYPNPDERGSSDIPAPAKTLDLIRKTPVLEDIILGEACYDDPDVKAKLRKLIVDNKPDYLNFEQPYLYIGMRKLLAELSIKPKIIFSSQNVEYSMKARIYAGHEHLIDAKSAKEQTALIRETEEQLCRDAEIVLAVSQSDINEHKKMGAKTVLLVPNGINPGVTTSQHVERWSSFMRKQGISKPILFTGSAHPPNWTGFLAMIGGRLGFLPITSKLMIVGDIGDALQYVLYREDPVYASSFWLRAHNCKRLSDEDLSALIQLCDTVILPITEGGGSNLKTAEAIYSKKNIVATEYAMRGYEEFRDFPNIFIEKDANSFRSRIVECLKTDAPRLTKVEQAKTSSVLWEERTKPLEDLLRRIG